MPPGYDVKLSDAWPGPVSRLAPYIRSSLEALIAMSALPGTYAGSARILGLVDVEEQYGRHVIASMLRKASSIRVAVDLGAGRGHDLLSVRREFPDASLTGIDFTDAGAEHLRGLGIQLRVLDLERDSLPFKDEGVDLIIANQILEHLKELFWICHQVALKLRPGGYFIVGVPNLAAFHNRILFLFGIQPSQLKSYSAHVRGFTASEVPRFFSVCFPNGFEILSRQGAQFYPFPRPIARILAGVAPSLAHSSFFLFRKALPYRGEFLRHPVAAQLETSFFLGEGKRSGRDP